MNERRFSFEASNRSGKYSRKLLCKRLHVPFTKNFPFVYLGGLEKYKWNNTISGWGGNSILNFVTLLFEGVNSCVPVLYRRG